MINGELPAGQPKALMVTWRTSPRLRHVHHGFREF